MASIAQGVVRAKGGGGTGASARGFFREGTYWGVFPVCERVTVMANGRRRRQPKRLGRKGGGRGRSYSEDCLGNGRSSLAVAFRPRLGPAAKICLLYRFLSSPTHIHSDFTQMCTMLYYCHLSFIQIHISLIEASEPPRPALNGLQIHWNAKRSTCPRRRHVHLGMRNVEWIS
jgi:hypothetical protein